MDEGLTKSIYELFEIILPVAILLLIGSAIFFVSNPDFNRAYVLEKEMSYISSLTNENTIVELNFKNTNYENLKVDVRGNNIVVNVDGEGLKSNLDSGTKYFGSDVKVEQKSESVVLISKQNGL